MNGINRTNQGGSTIAFIIIGLILATGLFGTIYYLRQHSEQVRREQAIAEYEQQQTEKESVTSTEIEPAVEASSSDENVAVGSSEPAITFQNLPASGAELDLSHLVAVFLLSITISGYILSRRNLARSL